MIITDTYPELLLLLQKMNGKFILEEWINYAQNISAGLPDKCLKDSEGYDFRTEILPVLHETAKSKDKLEKVHRSFLRATDGLSKRFYDSFKTDLDVKIILYLGLCNGAGWATMLDEQRVVLLGIEKIIELNWITDDDMVGLIYHELGHIWHDACRTQKAMPQTISENSILQLYNEGIAMYVEQLLVGDFDYFHQDKNMWLNWCKTNKEKLIDEYQKRISKEAETKDFFGDWNSYRGYSDVGYYLGAEFIKSLSKTYRLEQIADLKIEEICREFRLFSVEK